MRVALYEPCAEGGIFHYTFELADGLARRGATVTLFTKPGHELQDVPRPFEIQGQLERSQIKTWLQASLARLRPRHTAIGDRPSAPAAANARSAGAEGRWLGVRRIILWLELAAACLRRRVQVLHVQWLLNPESDYYFIKLFRLLGIRVVYTAHNLLPHESESPVDRAAFERIYRLVDRIVVHAEQNRQELLDTFDVEPGKIAVIPHGAYELFYRELTLTPAQARDALGLPQDRQIVLFFGSVRRYKGLEYLVEAYRKAKPKADRLMLLIVGRVQASNAADLAFYSRLLAELKDEDDVVYRPEYVSVEQMPHYFVASDLVAIPYAKTYQSGILALAYAAGRAVLVTDTGGLAEVVEPGKSGFLAPPCDADALAEALIEAGSDPDLVDAMGQYAKRLADTKYSWNDIAVRTLAVYQAAIERPRLRMNDRKEARA